MDGLSLQIDRRILRGLGEAEPGTGLAHPGYLQANI
jgi:hypothetical protein